MAESNNGLMKKTKAQLIEIILRKDEVERNCRIEINNLNEKLKFYDSDVKLMKNQLKADKTVIDEQANVILKKTNLIESMKSQFDISATEVAEAKETINLYKDYVKYLSVICSVLVIILISIMFVFQGNKDWFLGDSRTIYYLPFIN